MFNITMNFTEFIEFHHGSGICKNVCNGFWVIRSYRAETIFSRLASGLISRYVEPEEGEDSMPQNM